MCDPADRRALLTIDLANIDSHRPVTGSAGRESSQLSPDASPSLAEDQSVHQNVWFNFNSQNCQLSQLSTFSVGFTPHK